MWTDHFPTSGLMLISTKLASSDNITDVFVRHITLICFNQNILRLQESTGRVKV